MSPNRRGADRRCAGSPAAASARSARRPGSGVSPAERSRNARGRKSAPCLCPPGGALKLSGDVLIMALGSLRAVPGAAIRIQIRIGHLCQHAGARSADQAGTPSGMPPIAPTDDGSARGGRPRATLLSQQAPTPPPRSRAAPPRATATPGRRPAPPPRSIRKGSQVRVRQMAPPNALVVSGFRGLRGRVASGPADCIALEPS